MDTFFDHLMNGKRCQHGVISNYENLCGKCAIEYYMKFSQNAYKGVVTVLDEPTQQLIKVLNERVNQLLDE